MRRTLTLMLVALVAAVGATPTPTATAADGTPSPHASSSPTTAVTTTLYLVRDGKLGVSRRTLPSAGGVPGATFKALLKGPNRTERSAGLGSAIPAGVTLLGLEVNDGVATVDLSSEFEAGNMVAQLPMRVAQVVYTLTRFSSIDAVRFAVDGEPVDTLGGGVVDVSAPQRRQDWRERLPLIFVEQPAVGDAVDSPLTVRGSAMVFEATLVLELSDADGALLAKRTVTASAGAPERGTFTARLSFKRPAGTLVVLRAFAPSAEDGSRSGLVTLPLQLAP